MNNSERMEELINMEEEVNFRLANINFFISKITEPCPALDNLTENRNILIYTLNNIREELDKERNS